MQRKDRRRGFAAAGVADIHNRIDTVDSCANVRDKLGRGKIKAVFALRCMQAFDAQLLWFLDG
ncbi:MAG: DUF6471 domain-containing protein [Sphingomonadaceae bacterium]